MDSFKSPWKGKKKKILIKFSFNVLIVWNHLVDVAMKLQMKNCVLQSGSEIKCKWSAGSNKNCFRILV